MIEYKRIGDVAMAASRALHRATRPLGKAGDIIHAGAAWSSAFYMMGWGTAMAGLLSPLYNFAQTHRYVGAPAMALALRATGAEMRVFAARGFDPTEVSVFVQNHVSLLDAHVASNAIPQSFCGLMNAWQFNIPIYGWLMRQSRGIAVSPKKGNRAQMLTEEALIRRSEGLSILSFPEGHRTRDGQPQKHRSGIYRMARSAELPIVPIAVHGLYDINRRGQWKFNPGLITVVIGAQRPTAGLSDDELDALRGEVESWMHPIITAAEIPADMREVERWSRNGKMDGNVVRESGAP